MVDELQDELQRLQERVSRLEAVAEAHHHRYTRKPAPASGYGAPPAGAAA